MAMEPLFVLNTPSRRGKRTVESKVSSLVRVDAINMV